MEFLEERDQDTPLVEADKALDCGSGLAKLMPED
jgi:hypothetical protein